MTTMLPTILYYSSKIVLYYLILSMNGAALVAVYQESKIWNSTNAIPSLSHIGCIKVYIFNILWMIGCLMGTIYVVIKYIVSFGTSNIAYDSNRLVENYVAKICVTLIIGRVTVNGTEHLPPIDIHEDNDTDNKRVTKTTASSPAPVYIANHASQIDLGVVYYINRRFKWISKQSVLYVPGVGSIMYLSQHVFINRTKGSNKQSVSNLFQQSNYAIQSGIPMFFFPQGTRRIVERIPAKDGAFIVAQQNHSMLIPISIHIPQNAWNSYYPLTLFTSTKEVPNVIITIHPSIPSTTATTNTNEPNQPQQQGEERTILKNKCMEQIYSVLPTYDEYINSSSKVDSSKTTTATETRKTK